jgi:hypothetical protein
MKKIMYVMSALAAVFSGNALADVSVSGSGQFNYTSSGSSGFASTSGGISFALSTTTAGGVAISTSGGITQDAEGTAADGHTGFTSLAFATGGTTITLSNDISAGSVGSVGGVASGMVDVGHDSINASPAITIGDADGGGIALSTSAGAASVTATYVWDTTPGTHGQTDTSASDTVTGLKVSMPMGPLTLSGSYVAYDPGGSGTNDNLSGISAAYAVGGGTLTLGYETSTGSIKATETSGAYSMSLDADTTIAVGYTQADEGATSNSITEAKVTRALGGGASVYAEMKSSSGSGTSTTSSTNASTFAIGTSVSF